MYKVLKDFSDIQDHFYVYRAGDTYPRPGTNPSSGRIDELLGSNNARRRPLIQAVASDAEEDISLTEKKAKKAATGTKSKRASKPKKEQKKGQEKHAGTNS